MSFDIDEEIVGGGEDLGKKLCAALRENLASDDWDLLFRINAVMKSEAITADSILKHLDDFPPDVAKIILADPTTPIPFQAVFQFSEGYTVSAGAQHYELEGWFRVDPDCDCTESHVRVLPWTPSDTQPPVPGDAITTLRFDYARLCCLSVEGDVALAHTVLTAMGSNGVKSFGELLAGQHDLLRVAVDKALYKSDRVDLAQRSAPQIGRNDPCPCGSGKKYKKCCGA